MENKMNKNTSVYTYIIVCSGSDSCVDKTDDKDKADKADKADKVEVKDVLHGNFVVLRTVHGPPAPAPYWKRVRKGSQLVFHIWRYVTTR